MAYRLVQMTTTLLIGSEGCMRHVGLPLLSFTWSKSCFVLELSFLAHAQSKNLMNELSLQLYKLSISTQQFLTDTPMFMHNLFIAEKSRFAFTVSILLCQRDVLTLRLAGFLSLYCCGAAT